MRNFWKFIEAAMDAAVPFVCVALIYSIFIRSEPADPGFVTFCIVYLAYHFSQTNYQTTGGIGTGGLK